MSAARRGNRLSSALPTPCSPAQQHQPGQRPGKLHLITEVKPTERLIPPPSALALSRGGHTGRPELPVTTLTPQVGPARVPGRRGGGGR